MARAVRNNRWLWRRISTSNSSVSPATTRATISASEIDAEAAKERAASGRRTGCMLAGFWIAERVTALFAHAGSQEAARTVRQAVTLDRDAHHSRALDFRPQAR